MAQILRLFPSCSVLACKYAIPIGLRPVAGGGDMGMDTREDLALLHGRELRAEAAERRLVREARAVGRRPRRSRRGSPLRTAVGTGLVRAGLRLGGKPPVPGPGVA